MQVVHHAVLRTRVCIADFYNVLFLYLTAQAKTKILVLTKYILYIQRGFKYYVSYI